MTTETAAPASLVGGPELPQERRLSPVAGELIDGWLRDAGVVIRPSLTATSFEHLAGSTLVHVEDGSSFEVGHVVVATGAEPNVALAELAGLVTDEGVSVDASMRTTAADVFAVGDVAKAHNPAAGRALRVEHWGDAEAMGRVAGSVLAGQTDEWAEVPGFWSSITGHQLKYVSWGDGWNHVTARRSADGITVWYGTDGITVGVLTHNHDEDLELGRALIASRSPFPPM